MTTAFRIDRPAVRTIRMLLAVLVLAVRLGTPLLPMPLVAPAASGAAALALMLRDTPICHAGDPADPTPRHHPATHEHDCGLCPICHFVTAPLLAPDPAALLAPRAVVAEALLVHLPPKTGPPQQHRTAAHPRGPPSFSA